MDIINSHESILTRQFMERVNMWYFSAYRSTDERSVESVRTEMRALSTKIGDPNIPTSQLHVIGDILEILIHLLNENSLDQSSTLTRLHSFHGEKMFPNAKSRSLDTLVGHFTSVEATGTMLSCADSSKAVTNISKTPVSELKLPIAPTPSQWDITPQSSINVTPTPQTPQISIPCASQSTMTPPADGPLQRQIMSDFNSLHLQKHLTSSPVSDLAKTISQINLDSESESAIIKLCMQTKENMDKVMKIIEGPLNKTHDVSTSFLSRRNSISIAPPKTIKRQTARLSLGGNIHLNNLAHTSKISRPSVNVPSPKLPASNFVRNISTVKRRLSVSTTPVNSAGAAVPTAVVTKLKLPLKKSGLTASRTSLVKPTNFGYKN